MELLNLIIFGKMRLRKFYYRFVTVPYIGIKNLVSKSKCIDLYRFFVTEYTPLRIGKYGQDFRIENGPLVMEVMSRRPFLNVSGRASFDQTNNRRYKVTCDFFQDYVLSWKINGMEQLKEPITCWKKSTKKPQITLADFPTSVSRTLWHRIALYQIDQIDQLKINLLCLKQIQVT